MLIGHNPIWLGIIKEEFRVNRITCIQIIEATYIKGIKMEVGHRNRTKDLVLKHNRWRSKTHLDKNLAVVLIEVVMRIGVVVSNS